MREGWTYKKLGEVCQHKEHILRAAKLFEPNEKIDYIDISSIDNKQNIILSTTPFVFCEAPSRAQQKVEKGDILISLVRPNLKNIAIILSDDNKLVASSGFCVLRSNTTINNRYIFYIVRGKKFTNYLLARVQGANYPAVREDDIKGYILPVPPLSEQQRIVSELDLLSSIIEKKKAQLKEYDQLAQSIFYDMFGDPVTNEKGWEVKMLGNEFDVSSGGTPSTKNCEYWNDGKISWIGSNMCQNKIIYENDGKYITNEGLKHSSAKIYTKGFVLIALVGATIGKVALLGFETTTNQNIAGVDVPSNKDYKSIFIFYLIQSLYYFFENIGDGKFKMANLSFVRSLPIIKPPLPLQQSFASKIEAIEHQKALVQQSITETESLFNSRMDYYFD